MRAARWWVVALSLLAAACTGDDGAERDPAPPAALEVPEGPVHDATVQPDGDGVWLVGGTTGTGADRRANPVAIRYGTDLRPQRTVALPLPDGRGGGGRFLFGGRVVPGGEAPVVVGSLCEVSAGDEPVCGGPQVPVVLRLDGDRAAEPVPDTPRVLGGPGGATVAGGTLDGRVLVVRAMGTGSPEGDGPVRAWWLDPDDGGVEPAPVPDGLVSPDAMCAAGGKVHAVLTGPAPGGAGTLRVVEVAASGEVLPVVDLEPPPLLDPTSTLHCLGDLLVVRVGTSPSQLTVVDPTAGALVGEPLRTTGWAHVAGAPGGTVVTTAERSDARRPEERPVLRVAYHRVHEREGFRPAGGAEVEPGAQPVGVLLDGSLVDADRVRREPRGG